jgi:hypothetical protein
MNQIIPFPRKSQSDAINVCSYSLKRADECADRVKALVDHGVEPPPAMIAALRQAMHDAKSAFEKALWSKLLPSSDEFRRHLESKAAEIVTANTTPEADELVETLDRIIPECFRPINTDPRSA